MNSIIGGIHGSHGASNVPEGAGNNLFRGDLFAIFAAIAARAQLVSSLDLVECSVPGIAEFYRIRRVPQKSSFRRGFDRNAVSRGYRDRNRSARGVNAGHDPAHAALLPVFAVVLLLLGQVR